VVGVSLGGVFALTFCCCYEDTYIVPLDLNSFEQIRQKNILIFYFQLL
jgi:esterase/lipase